VRRIESKEKGAPQGALVEVADPWRQSVGRI
jgi:hypothetical protein